MTLDKEATEVLISYAWAEDSVLGEERNQFISELQLAFKRRGIKILIDKEEVTYKKSITDFMKKIGNSKYVITIISDKYLKSKYCMYEALQIFKDEDYYNRIFPVVFKDAKIYDPIETLDYVKYWTEKIKELNSKLLELGELAYCKPLIEELDLYFEIRRLLARFTEIMSDLNTLTPEKLKENNFEILFNAINTLETKNIAETKLRYCVDLVFCVDTRISKPNLDAIKEFWGKENLQLIKDMFQARDKSVETIRAKIIEANNPAGINTKFYNLSQPNEANFYYNKWASLTTSDKEIKDLEFLKRAIQSDWLDNVARARHIIFVFSENTIVGDIPNVDEITDLWEENDYMRRNARRLILFAPETPPWSIISNNWENAMHYPTNSISQNVLRNYNKNSDLIMSAIVYSI